MPYTLKLLNGETLSIPTKYDQETTNFLNDDSVTTLRYKPTEDGPMRVVPISAIAYGDFLPDNHPEKFAFGNLTEEEVNNAVAEFVDSSYSSSRNKLVIRWMVAEGTEAHDEVKRRMLMLAPETIQSRLGIVGTMEYMAKNYTGHFEEALVREGL